MKKKYRRPVFSGKDIPVIGIDQGKGKMYPGIGTWYCFNLFYDAAMLNREGQTYEQAYEAVIQNAGRTESLSFVHTESSFWVEKREGL